ncbi:MAG: hypothetical protein KBC84_01400 [Proteobacteria bacterium]|nr:hypothetical protein [Pseudomonadota bacterium]
MTKQILLAAILTFTSCIGAGQNSTIKSQASYNYFPELIGINLHGQEKKVPSELPGGKKLLIVAYQRAQQKDVDTWIDSIDKVQSKIKDLKFYEIPLIEKGSAFFRFYVNNGMRSGITDEIRRGEVITVYTEVDKFLPLVRQKNTDLIKTFLLNSEGKILSEVEGRFSENNLALLSTVNE